MSRLPRLRPDQLDADQAALYAEITGGPRAQGPQHFPLTDREGALNGPFNALLAAPALGRALQALGAAVRYETSLSPRVREAAILLVAAHWGSEFERFAHESVGRAVGLSEVELDQLRAGAPAFADPVEAASAVFVLALLAGDTDDAQWAAAREHLDDRALFELSTLVGYYATLALQLRVFRADGVPEVD